MERITNEQKAKELADCCPNCTFSCGDRLNCKTESTYNKLLQMAQWKEQQMISRALKHLQDVYTQFDITDTSGYGIDFRLFKYEFEKAMIKGE